MNSHNMTIVGYLVVVLAGLVLEFVSSRRGSKVPSLSTVLSRVMRTRSGRVGILAGWAWLGMHFFAR